MEVYRDRYAMAPQWSPVVTTGTTGCVACALQVEGGAAMEPRRDDGDDRDLLRQGVPRKPAAMEPRRDDGDDRAAAKDAPFGLSGRNGAPS